VAVEFKYILVEERNIWEVMEASRSSQNRNAKDRMLRFRNFFCRSKLAATLTWISVSVLVYLAFRMSLESSDPSPALVTYSDSGKQLERYFFPILMEVMHFIPLLHFAALVTPTNDICKLRRNFEI
ncbi:hypothetical protein BHE74_00013006, partial [Ensete ventricosum]